MNLNIKTVLGKDGPFTVGNLFPPIECLWAKSVTYLFGKWNKKSSATWKTVLIPNLRHTFCTRLCEVETNIKYIQDVMGHKKIETTMEIYNEVTKEFKQQKTQSLQGKLKIA